VQSLLIGTHTSDEEPNYVQVASVQLPSESEEQPSGKSSKGRKKKGTGLILNRVRCTGTAAARVKITQKIPHEGEVNRARYQPSNPNMIATKTRSGDVLVFDRKRHASFPVDRDEKCSPLLRLTGHDKEG
jgi:histone-binding protein RBBP4